MLCLGYHRDDAEAGQNDLRFQTPEFNQSQKSQIGVCMNKQLFGFQVKDLRIKMNLLRFGCLIATNLLFLNPKAQNGHRTTDPSDGMFLSWLGLCLWHGTQHKKAGIHRQESKRLTIARQNHSKETLSKQIH